MANCLSYGVIASPSVMWQQNYQFAGGSLGYSALIAATPLLLLFYLLGVRRRPAWVAGLSALGVAWADLQALEARLLSQRP